MKFKISYCLFFIICLLYSPIMMFGPISIRHIFILFMLVLCYVEGGLKFDRFLKWYFVFLLFCLFSSVLTGFALTFFNKLFGTYLASIVLYLSTRIIIRKYHAQDLVIYLIISLACLNSIVAIGQFYKLPFAMAIPSLLNIVLEEDMLDYYERFEDFQGRYVGGLLGVVNSGYYLSAACVLSLCLKFKKLSFLTWVIFAINFYALYLVQQRSGFFIGIFSVSIFIILNMTGKRRSNLLYTLLFLFVVTMIWYYGDRFFQYNEMRYFTQGLIDENRGLYAEKGWEYFLNHPFGGIYAFRAIGSHDPHSLFVNAFLYGGILGGAIILCYIFYQLVLVGKILVNSFCWNKYSVMLLGFALAYMNYTLSSFFHNLSLVYGEIMFFMLWSGVVSLYEIENMKKKRKV